MKVGLAGAGNMATAIARGWAAADGGPEQMLFYDPLGQKAKQLAAEVGGEAVAGPAELAQRSDLLLLAVKPAALAEVAEEAGAAKAVLSILAATPLRRVEEAFPGVPAFRAMPNQPVAVGRGVICLTHGDGVDPGIAGALRSQLELLGRVVDLDDSLFDAATAVMSSTPAYFALIAEAIAEAGANHGLEPELAASLTAETLAGTGAMLLHHDAVALRAAVASPGGATEAGLDALAGAAAAGAFVEAVEASLERMRQL
jgi:pyrroline-5-carboxylate reductase